MDNWEKEFDEKFDRKIVYFDGLNHNHHIFGTMGLAKDIKQFIQEQIKKAFNMVDLGDKCFIYINTPDVSGEFNVGWERGYNKAIDDLKYIKEKLIKELERE